MINVLNKIGPGTELEELQKKFAPINYEIHWSLLFGYSGTGNYSSV